jgi:antitoxin HigA-1
MSITNTRSLQRNPVHPGEILREEFMADYELTVSAIGFRAGSFPAVDQ